MKVVNKYQKHEEKLQKEARKRYQNLSVEEKEKESISIIMNIIRIFLRRKKKRKFSIRKIIM